ncbi:MAG: hypothetical protein K1X55_17715 [Chitinophagales bacterium]|nr:hypothetical protein [Chitinophagales bacterium]
MEERRSKTVFVVFFSIQMAKFLSNVVFGFQHCMLDYLGLLSTLVLLIGFLRTLKKYKKIGAEYFIWILWWSLVVFNGIGESIKSYCLGSVVLASLNDGFAVILPNS